MLKSDLIKELAEKNPHLKEKDIKFLLESFLSIIKDSIKEDKRVELRSFGVFTPSLKKAREGLNPKTGKKIRVETKKSVRFKPGKVLFDSLNNK